MALKKCKECGKEISDEAGKCPHCGKPQTSKNTWGCLIVIILAVLGFSWLVSSPHSSIPDHNADPTLATDNQIYREFEICMNAAKGKIDDNKLEGQKIAALCVSQLNKYGDKRAKKAFDKYFE